MLELENNLPEAMGLSFCHLTLISVSTLIIAIESNAPLHANKLRDLRDKI